ncbi:hypothetical protein [Halobellus sp. GM3]|uniref:hypothetical protein n=1 Tax=Halobellus sp. GM3 TaxID=3458410 RepID=UPI00403D85E5
MRRRQAIAAVGAAFAAGASAGCLGRRGLPLVGSDPHPRRLAISDVDALSSDVAFEIDAELPTATVTDRHPATLALAARNTGDERAISVGTDRCRPFNRGSGRSENEGLWLYPARDEPSPRVDGRWTYDPDGPIGFASYGCSLRDWDAGESQTYVYAVWADPLTDGYYEPGTYRWTHRVRTAPAGSETDVEPTATATWGLTLEVEDA